MKKVSATYHAPKGDSKVCVMFGHTFFDGKAEEVTVSDAIYDKLSKNASFECGKPTDKEKEPAKEPEHKEHKSR